MLTRPFGSTGLTVSALGLGAGQIGGANLSDDHSGSLLNAALDLGITLIDTARGYGLSEERIGRHIAHRRDSFVLSSKCGYGFEGEGIQDWTGPCIERGVDAALQRMRTDRIDVMHLHSCPLEVLQRGEVIAALERARKAGKVRCAAYSGENEALRWAAAAGSFQSLQTSVNLCDQRSLRDVLPIASRLGLGVIAKRPIANAFWRHAACPTGDYCEVYWKRAREMGLTPPAVAEGGAPGEPMAWDEFAIRFSAFAPGVSCVIAGTASIENLRRNAAMIERGPLPREVVSDVMLRFERAGTGWPGQV